MKKPKSPGNSLPTQKTFNKAASGAKHGGVKTVGDPLAKLVKPKKSHNAPPSEQQQAQINAHRRIMDNTRYKVGKKNKQGFYETHSGQYANAKALGAI